MRRDLADVARLVSGLLSLSRAERDGEAGSGVRSVNLGLPIVREVGRVASTPRLEAEHREIEVIAPEAALLANADAGALRDMIGVLIDNALCHGQGRISVAIESGEAGEQVLRVSDEGAGVARERWNEVFQRFHKLDSNSPGAGLGLAIARQTARNQGGEASFVDPATVEVRRWWPRLRAIRQRQEIRLMRAGRATLKRAARLILTSGLVALTLSACACLPTRAARIRRRTRC